MSKSVFKVFLNCAITDVLLSLTPNEKKSKMFSILNTVNCPLPHTNKRQKKRRNLSVEYVTAASTSFSVKKIQPSRFALYICYSFAVVN